MAASTSASSGSAVAAMISRSSFSSFQGSPDHRSAPRRIGDEATQRRRDAATHGPGKAQQDQRRAGDDEPGVDLLALDDIAALVCLVEPLLGRVFGLFGSSRSPAIAAYFHMRGASSCSTPSTEPRKVAIIAPSTSSRMKEPDQDRHRQADEEHLHLRHQPRQHTKAQVEQQPEHDERRRELDADAERRSMMRVVRAATSPITGISPGANRL